MARWQRKEPRERSLIREESTSRKAWAFPGWEWSEANSVSSSSSSGHTVWAFGEARKVW
jgi:hypothetical protein